MTRPLSEPGMRKDVVGLGYDTRQLYRRPVPSVTGTGFGGITFGNLNTTQISDPAAGASSVLLYTCPADMIASLHNVNFDLDADATDVLRYPELNWYDEDDVKYMRTSASSQVLNDSVNYNLIEQDGGTITYTLVAPNVYYAEVRFQPRFRMLAGHYVKLNIYGGVGPADQISNIVIYTEEFENA